MFFIFGFCVCTFPILTRAHVVSTGGELADYWLRSSTTPGRNKSYLAAVAKIDGDDEDAVPFMLNPDDRRLLMGWMMFTGLSFGLEVWSNAWKLMDRSLKLLGLSRRGQDLLGLFGFGLSSRTRKRHGALVAEANRNKAR